MKLSTIGIGIAGVFSVVSPALADMGPAIAVAVIGAASWHLILGVVTIVPRWMSGRRVVALAIYFGTVVVSWLINLAMPVDSLQDFTVIGVLPLVASLCLIIYAFMRRAQRGRARS